MKSRIFLSFLVLSSVSLCRTADAVTIYASGQLLVENQPGTHDDVRENYIYSIDTTTGIAVAISPKISGAPAALAGGADQRLFGYQSGQLGEVDVNSGSFAAIGAATGIQSTGFEIISGTGYLVTFGTDQLYKVNLENGVTTSIGVPITLPSVSDPFIISLGAVGDTLYGVNLSTGANNLVSIDPLTAQAAQIGTLNAVEQSGYSGFAALTGVDESGDGIADSLYGNVNFLNGSRIGGLVRYNLVSGEWSLVGTNPGIIFFGFGSPVPEPASLLLIAAGLCGFRVSRKKLL